MCASARSTRAVAAARFCLQAGAATNAGATGAGSAATAAGATGAMVLAVAGGAEAGARTSPEALDPLRRSSVTVGSAGRAGLDVAVKQSSVRNGHSCLPQSAMLASLSALAEPMSLRSTPSGSRMKSGDAVGTLLAAVAVCSLMAAFVTSVDVDQMPMAAKSATAETVLVHLPMPVSPDVRGRAPLKISARMMNQGS